MTLESKLFELSTLVDYGTYYLSKKKEFTTDDVLHFLSFGSVDAEEILDRLEYDKVARYAGKWCADETLNEIPTDTIYRYLTDNYMQSDIIDGLEIDTDSLLNDIDSYTLKQYIKYNYDPDDVFDEDDMLDSISPETILDYLANSEPDMIVDWVKGNYNTSDLIDVSGIDWK